MKLKELRFYMDGTTPMVEVKHDIDGATEVIRSPAAELGNINGITVKLAEAIVKKVKSNVQQH